MLDADIMDDTERCVGDGDGIVGRVGNEWVEDVGVSGGDRGKGMERIRGSSGDNGRACSSSDQKRKAQRWTSEGENEWRVLV